MHEPHLIEILSENPRGSRGDDGELKLQEGEIVGGLLFPTNEQSSGSIEPGVREFDFPAARLAAAVLRLGRFVRLPRNVRHVAAFAGFHVDRRAGVAFVEAEMLRVLVRRFGPFERNCLERFGDELRIRHVGDGDRLGDAAAVDERRTLHPRLAPIGRILAGFFPAKRRLGQRAVQALPFPIDSFQHVVLGRRELPQLLEHARLRPLLKMGVDRAARAELARHRLPLAARREHVENSRHGFPQRQAGPTAARTRLVIRQHQVDPLPRRVGDLMKLRRRAGHKHLRVDREQRSSISLRKLA